MTTSDHRKVLKQIGKKPGKLAKFQKHNVPKERSCGIATKKCRRCGRTRAHIDKYGMDLCRQCFREVATEIGFKKYY
ncbi:30S ribosomal protein S14 [Candidatus Woesearchaeota archaeon]|nr:MAG: 30S ribosomal protein S14 [Candidatus Woesearchaeota archaeon]